MTAIELYARAHFAESARLTYLSARLRRHLAAPLARRMLALAPTLDSRLPSLMLATAEAWERLPKVVKDAIQKPEVMR